jgi:hypothetical protein
MEKPAVSIMADRPVIWLNVLATFLIALFTILAWIAASRNGDA